jgi:hypothetical protein
VKPSEKLADLVKTFPGVIQVSADVERNALSIQVESEDRIPEGVRRLVEAGASILRVNPRDYTLEDIYFHLQAGRS